MHRAVFELGKRIFFFFFFAYVALSSLAKHPGAGFSEGVERISKGKKDPKKEKKKIEHVMTEGNSFSRSNGS